MIFESFIVTTINFTVAIRFASSVIVLIPLTLVIATPCNPNLIFESFIVTTINFTVAIRFANYVIVLIPLTLVITTLLTILIAITKQLSRNLIVLF